MELLYDNKMLYRKQENTDKVKIKYPPMAQKMQRDPDNISEQ